jgi:hypothetical protein
MSSLGRLPRRHYLTQKIRLVLFHDFEMPLADDFDGLMGKRAPH